MGSLVPDGKLSRAMGRNVCCALPTRSGRTNIGLVDPGSGKETGIDWLITRLTACSCGLEFGTTREGGRDYEFPRMCCLLNQKNGYPSLLAVGRREMRLALETWHMV